MPSLSASLIWQVEVQRRQHDAESAETVKALRAALSAAQQVRSPSISLDLPRSPLIALDCPHSRRARGRDRAPRPLHARAHDGALSAATQEAAEARAALDTALVAARGGGGGGGGARHGAPPSRTEPRRPTAELAGDAAELAGDEVDKLRREIAEVRGVSSHADECA